MASLHERFSGLFIPHVTPFESSGALDLESLARLTKYFSSLPGVAGLVSCARIGESPVSSLEEKRRVYEISGKAVHDAGKVHIATIAPQSTDEAVESDARSGKLAGRRRDDFSAPAFRLGKSRSELQSPFLRRPGARNQITLGALPNTGEKLLLRSGNHLPHRPSWKTSSPSKKHPSTSICSRKQFKHSSATKPPCGCSPATTALSPKAIGSAPTAR